MPLINCPECSAEVSDSALKCMKCGVQLRKAKRGFFGNLFKWTFIVFNFLMAWWLIGGMHAATSAMESTTGAGHVGAAIGTGIGAFMIIGLWVFGDIILGLFVLFTRPKNS
ncbi:MAG TPA: zinc ribbon domain-containing protein [Marinagarivorans sp.]|nr:zinc ribbon domain-containing protein [Cellvibrionaceae bacterium]HMY38019.1 zinc ribbon domain-containing protein [Marinagarivorans sp.]HNG60045.1 zinc ribbon domain-containing protein [Cellvibrionaceae bacterium]